MNRSDSPEVHRKYANLAQRPNRRYSRHKRFEGHAAVMHQNGNEGDLQAPIHEMRVRNKKSEKVLTEQQRPSATRWMQREASKTQSSNELRT